MFAAFSPEQLLELGVAEPLLPLIAKITTEDELLGLLEYAPSLTAEVLLALHDGLSPDEVLEQVTAPVRADEPVDVTDFAAAMTRPATLVTTDDAALQAVLAGRLRPLAGLPAPAAAQDRRAVLQRARPGSAAARAPARRSSPCTG